MDIQKILEFLPHRYPFLLIDRVLEASPTHFRVLKNVTFNEPFFPGHFPSYPVMPGVLILESMAQAAVACIAQQPDARPGGLVFLASVEEARFRKPVVPGDTLIHEGELLSYRRGLGKVRVVSKVGDDIHAEATLMFMARPGA